MAISISVLGVMEIGDGRTCVPLGGPGQRRLLCALLARQGWVVPSGDLIGELWPAARPRGVQEALYVQVSRLRRVLMAFGDAEVLLLSRSPGYVLKLPSGCVDADRFRQLCTAAEGQRTAAPAAAADLYDQALGLWRGPAFQDVPAGPIRDKSVDRLAKERRLAVSRLAELQVGLGRYDEAIALLEGLALRHPLDERVCLQLMTAFDRVGRAGDALDAYQRTRASLIMELGVSPSPLLESGLRGLLERTGETKSCGG
ncbi:AfsR/SARP family transcriptional regulator [Streptomyces microflavus]|uniref:AfsR/SARP family transcriptional regulator n=1 Tax=Streptomyces microflavus TaxID=1919 RepID=UPI002E0D87B9|nr:AfsR/SARP family transcriptional regulator [Streptomyces microflavus]